MSTHREGVNPLRPYYIPPTIGDRVDPVATTSSTPFPGGTATSSSKYASKARDVFSDIDYNSFVGEDSPSVVQSAKELVDELLWKYTSVLIAQPFEVAKMILQVQDQDANAALATPAETEIFKKKNSSQGASIYDV